MRDLALLMFVGATLPIAFMRPVVGLMLWIMFSYMNPHRITWGFATAFPWVMIVAVVAIMATFMHAGQRQRIQAKPVIVLMTLFVAWTGITTLFAVEPVQAQQYWIQFFKIVLLAYFTLILVTDEQKLHWVLWTIVLSFGFWGLKGGLFTGMSGGGYHVLGPPRSFFRDNNDFALVMCMTLPLMRYLQLYETRKWINYGLWVLMALTALAVVGTYSRGGFLALGATMFMLVLKSRRKRSLIVLVPMVAVAIAAFMPQQYYARIYSINDYQDNASATGRIDSWKFATNYAVHHPVLGGGLLMSSSDTAWNTYGPPGATHRAIHSVWFRVLGEHSFIGIGLYVAMLIAAWLSLARIRKRTRDVPDKSWMTDLASMIQVSLVAFVVAGTFLPMAYFDLVYQLLALTALLQVFSLATARQKSPVQDKPAERNGDAVIADQRLRSKAYKKLPAPRGGLPDW